MVIGLGIKRWILLLLLGGILLGLGLGYALMEVATRGMLPAEFDILLLRYIPSWGRALILGLTGLALMMISMARMYRRLLSPFVRPGQDVAGALNEHARRGRGPRIVAIGGGTGLSVLLRGLKRHTSNLTAIVTVADDGGSSGRLRRALGVLPPGDFRNCLAALADDDALTTQLFQYRFGDRELGGHSFGNLFITAMAEVAGSFERGLIESSRVLAIRGRVLPSTLTDVTLMGELTEAGSVSLVEGESQITLQPGLIRRVSLAPDDVPAYPEVIRAILEADLVVIGPGSLYTSIMPNLLVRDLADALRATRAPRVYVCNTATQPGETVDYSVHDHVDAIERHAGPGVVEYVLANYAQTGRLPERLAWVRLDPPVNGARRLLTADLADEQRPWRHDSAKLAAALMSILSQPGGLAPGGTSSAPLH